MTTQKTTAELIAWLREFEQNTYAMLGLTPTLSDPELVKDFTERAKKAGQAADRLAELEAALETIINMHDGNPSPIANPEPLDYARQVMRDMRLVAKQALQPKDSNT